MKSSTAVPIIPSPSQTTTMWLVRHAEVEKSYQGVFGGRIDMDLSPRGHEQATALAAYLLGHRFDAVYASPMRRVQQTLAPFQVNGVIKAVVVPELREFDFGDWTGLTFDEVHKKFGVRAEQWLHQIEAGAVPRGECTRRLAERLAPWLSQVMAQHGGETVLVACHGGVIRMLLAMLLHWPLSRFSAVEIDYASVTQVVCEPEATFLQLLNLAPWRDLPKPSAEPQPK